MMYYHEGNGMDGWVAATLARLDEANTPPWTDATSERTGTMTTEATARIVLPGNKTGSVPDITITDETGERTTLWDFTAWAPEEQTLKGAEDLLAQFGWRTTLRQPVADGQWTLNVEAR